MAALALGMALWLLTLPAPVWADSTPAEPITARLTASPPAVAPGEPLTYTLTLENRGELDQQVAVTATLPAGFELALIELPTGSSYNLRTRMLQWSGKVPAGGTRMLALPGTAGTELRPDGRLVAQAAVHAAEVIHLSATGWAGTVPTAAFSFSSKVAATADRSMRAVQFTNQSSGTGPLSFWWDFGDGTTSSETNPLHTFPGGGEYTVRLTATNPGGTRTAAQKVVVNAAPAEVVERLDEYDFRVSDETPAVGQPIYFDDVGEYVPAAVRWNFGDGGVSEHVSPVYVYQQPGAYTVTRVLGQGETAIQSSLALVVGYQPDASIQVGSSVAGMNQLITFTAQTDGLQVARYYWDFGDGGTAVSPYVAHSYSVPGTYSVTLVVSNEFGAAMDTLTLRVTPYTIFLPLVAHNAAPPAPAEEPEPTESLEPELSEPAVDAFAQQMLTAINAERAAAGLPPLRWSEPLARSSQHHTDDMAAYGFTGHYGSNESRPIDRMRQASYTGDYAGECTAWGFDNLASAVAWWMSSPPHRTIILSTVATEMGGAYSYNPGAPSVHYWTIDFGAD